MNYDDEYLEEENTIQESPKKKEPVKLDSGGKVAKDAAVAAATIYGGKLGGNLVKAASHTNLGKNVLNTGGKILNGGSNIVSNINRNPLGMMGRNIPSQSDDSSSNQDSIAKENNTNDKDNNRNNNSNKNEDKNKLSFNLFGNNKKMSFLKKMKLYFAVGGIVAFLFILILFIMIFLDVDMTKMLGTLDWNNDVVDNNTNISSDTDFSSDNSVEIKDNDLMTLIGEDNIKAIEDTIISRISNNKCNNLGVANSVIALIDGLNKHNLKIPYVENGRNNKDIIVNPNWGTKLENNVETINGLDDKGLVLWAMNVSGINIDESFDFNALEDYTTLSEITSGDILRGTDLKIVLQNTGSTIKVAEASIDGITYKEYSYQTLSEYNYLSMANFYTVYCSN